MESGEFEEIDQKAREGVEKAHASLRGHPILASFPEGIRKDVLLGMQFTVTNINFVTNIVTLSLVESTQQTH